MLPFRDGIWAKSANRPGDRYDDSAVIFGELRGGLVMSNPGIGWQSQHHAKRGFFGEQTFSPATRQGRLGLAGHA